MRGTFHFDSKFYQTADKAVNLIKLNILWILFSVPLVTMGAASCALHEIASKIVRNEDGYILRDFLTVFQRKWKQALKLWMPLLLSGVGIVLELFFWRNVGGLWAEVMTGMLVMLAVIWPLLFIYAFPLAVRMETSTRTTLCNALLLAVKHLPESLYMLFWTGIFLVAGWLWIPVLLIEIFTGAAVLAAVQEKVLLKIFGQEQIPEPAPEQ